MAKALQKRERNSAIEALKIVAMIAIVFSHVTQSLQLPEISGGGAALNTIDTLSYCVDFKTASADPTMWLLVCLRTLGAWGNAVFVICSAWFLCKSDKVSLNKIVKMVLDVFLISVVILVVALLVGVRPGIKNIVKCLLPTTFANNWFITSYLLLYMIHPALNWIFERLGKRGHAALAIGLFCLYMLFPVAHGGHFFTSELIVMITEYVIVGYARFYLPETMENKRAACTACLVGTLGTLVLVALLEVAGLHIGALANKMFHFDKDGDPLLFLSAFGLFNLVRTHFFVSVRVSRVAAPMLFVYLIHENLIVRTYARPSIWLWVHDTLGYGALVIWIVTFSLALFAVALACAFAYTRTLGKVAARMEIPVERMVRKVGRYAVGWLCGLR